jgi:PIN domain nuclease of toxin-antitoxin system
VRLLLDTQAVVWSLLSPERIRSATRRRILQADAVFVSAVSAAEIAVKVSIGKLDVPADLERQAAEAGFDQLPLTFRHAAAVRALPLHHRDPFDRILVAQAMVEGLTIVTSDRWFAHYGVAVIPA